MARGEALSTVLLVTPQSIWREKCVCGLLGRGFPPDNVVAFIFSLGRP